jgi:hypothetical protein
MNEIAPFNAGNAIDSKAEDRKYSQSRLTKDVERELGIIFWGYPGPRLS